MQRSEDKTIEIESFCELGDRSAVICHKLLDAICYGNNVISPSLTIDDKNRKQYYDLLIALYSTERKYLDAQRSIGIKLSAKNGNYKGRARIKIDKLAAQLILQNYLDRKF